MASEFPILGEDLKKIVKKSRLVPIAFGFNPGTTDEDDEYFAAHVRKKPEVLGRLALHDGAGTKTAFGTFQAVSSELRLCCFRTIPQLAKRIKRYLKRNKIVLNVVVTDPDGNMIDCDIEVLTEWEGQDETGAEADLPVVEVPDEDDDPRLAAAEDAPDPALDPLALAARMKALQPEVAAAPSNVAEKVGGAFAGAVELIRTRRLAEAEAAISKLEMVLARLAQAGRAARVASPDKAAAPTRDADPRQPGLRRAVERMDDAIADLPAAMAQRARLAEAIEALDQGEIEAALGILREVRAALARARAARARWQRAEALAAPVIARALAERSIADPDALRAQWAEVRDLAETGAHHRALAEMPMLLDLLRATAQPQG